MLLWVIFQTASLLEEVNKLKEENFLILHGTADGEVFSAHVSEFVLVSIWNCLVKCVRLFKARVHFQHSAELLSRLVKVEANYSLQLYPDEGHILREARSIQHFQRTVVNYLHTCLKHSTLPDPIEDEEEEDDWAQASASLLLDGLSKRTVCNYLQVFWHKSSRVGDQTQRTFLFRKEKKIYVLYDVLCTIISAI